MTHSPYSASPTATCGGDPVCVHPYGTTPTVETQNAVGRKICKIRPDCAGRGEEPAQPGPRGPVGGGGVGVCALYANGPELPSPKMALRKSVTKSASGCNKKPTMSSIRAVTKSAGFHIAHYLFQRWGYVLSTVRPMRPPRRHRAGAHSAGQRVPYRVRRIQAPGMSCAYDCATLVPKSAHPRHVTRQMSKTRVK